MVLWTSRSVLSKCFYEQICIDILGWNVIQGGDGFRQQIANAMNVDVDFFFLVPKPGWLAD